MAADRRRVRRRALGALLLPRLLARRHRACWPRCTCWPRSASRPRRCRELMARLRPVRRFRRDQLDGRRPGRRRTDRGARRVRRRRAEFDELDGLTVRPARRAWFNLRASQHRAAAAAERRGVPTRRDGGRCATRCSRSSGPEGHPRRPRPGRASGIPRRTGGLPWPCELDPQLMDILACPADDHAPLRAGTAADPRAQPDLHRVRPRATRGGRHPGAAARRGDRTATAHDRARRHPARRRAGTWRPCTTRGVPAVGGHRGRPGALRRARRAGGGRRRSCAGPPPPRASCWCAGRAPSTPRPHARRAARPSSPVPVVLAEAVPSWIGPLDVVVAHSAAASDDDLTESVGRAVAGAPEARARPRVGRRARSPSAGAAPGAARGAAHHRAARPDLPRWPCRRAHRGRRARAVADTVRPASTALADTLDGEAERNAPGNECVHQPGEVTRAAAGRAHPAAVGHRPARRGRRRARRRSLGDARGDRGARGRPSRRPPRPPLLVQDRPDRTPGRDIFHDPFDDDAVTAAAAAPALLIGTAEEDPLHVALRRFGRDRSCRRPPASRRRGRARRTARGRCCARGLRRHPLRPGRRLPGPGHPDPPA